MEIGSQVKLNTFNETIVSPDKCEPHENYWALIGSTGIISSPINSRGRVLVTFDVNVINLGLDCHNQVSNSLLILLSDLEVL